MHVTEGKMRLSVDTVDLEVGKAFDALLATEKQAEQQGA